MKVIRVCAVFCVMCVIVACQDNRGEKIIGTWENYRMLHGDKETLVQDRILIVSQDSIQFLKAGVEQNTLEWAYDEDKGILTIASHDQYYLNVYNDRMSWISVLNEDAKLFFSAKAE